MELTTGKNMHRILRCALISIVMLSSQMIWSQTNTSSDFMRSTGKIYVVAAVTIVILLTIFAYLIIIDRKISRIEKRHKNE
jgi:hypothetical protein